MSNFEDFEQFDDMGMYHDPDLRLEQQIYGSNPEYHPSPITIGDTQVGWDSDGNYHVIDAPRPVPDIEGRDVLPRLQRENRPENTDVAGGLNPELWIRRWVETVQSRIAEYVSTYDYTVGRLERDMIAHDIVDGLIEQNALEAELAMDALHQWKRIYGGQGERA